jgi:CPA2 family monovalent cation:H+ antiporter-2
LISFDLPFLIVAGGVLLLLFLFGYFGSKIKIPNVVIYILLGIVLGRFITDDHILHIAGEIGLVLLFFLLGMEFTIDRLGGIAKKVWTGGLLDVILNLGITMVISYLFGLSLLESFIVGGIVYATSSSITAKMLESTKRMANAESEFILALLIFEDLVAPILVAVLIGLTSGEEITVMVFLILILKIILLSIGAVLIGRFGFRKLSSFVERNYTSDMFILFTVGVALTYGGLAIMLGLSEVLGAFLAGIMIAEVRKTHEIEHAALPVRDLLLPLFFLYFGTTIAFGEGISMYGLFIVLIFWSLIAKITVGIIGGRQYGLSPKVALRAGLSLGARGEFSVIIASLAVGSLMIFASIYIIVIAILGILLFEFAPKITTIVYGTPVKKERNLKVPE